MSLDENEKTVFFSILFFSFSLSLSPVRKANRLASTRSRESHFPLSRSSKRERKLSLEGARICGVRPTDDRREQSFNEIRKRERLGLSRLFYHRRILLSAAAKRAENFGNDLVQKTISCFPQLSYQSEIKLYQMYQRSRCLPLKLHLRITDVSRVAKKGRSETPRLVQRC